MKADEKLCPKCAEIIKKAALVCKHCHYEFSPTEVVKSKKELEKNNLAVGCVVLLVFILLIAMCSGGDDSGTSEPEDLAKSAEDRRKGFHCLSAWDGSSRQFTQLVKANLRDPDSFEHIETRIIPANEKGQHAILMKYRAKNGFGGMNVGSALGTVAQTTCDATLAIPE